MLAGVVTSRPKRKPARAPKTQVLATKKVSYQTDARGVYRVFNEAVYRFYRSQTAPPVEGDTPFDTNATLPHEPADTFGDGVWFISTSFYDGIYDSGFLPLGPLGETYIRLDLTAGVETTSPSSGPAEWHLENVGGGIVRVVASYAQDGTLRADQWSIAWTFNGSEPATSTPDAAVDIPADGLAVLTYSLPAQADGITVKVRLQTRRLDAAYVYSEDSEVRTLIADDSGPTAVQTLTGAS